VHHNQGPGLWTDIDNIRTTYDGNVVTDNEEVGIYHEISYDAVIRNNTVMRNGKKFWVWLWGAQILLSGSQNVEVYGNRVVVDASGGNGIALIQQNRGTGKFGPYRTRNNWVHHNEVTYLGMEGASGAVADFDEAGLLSSNNRFDYNIYHLPADWNRWFWGDETDWVGFRASGHEANGTADTYVGTTVTAPAPAVNTIAPLPRARM
jgi:parallel beta-helix repeat protein